MVLDISPNGQVPVLITDGGQALFESDAIVEYLEEAYPRLQPDIALETRATNRAWSYLASKNYLVQCSAQRSPDRDTLQERSAKLGKVFDRMEKHFGGPALFRQRNHRHGRYRVAAAVASRQHCGGAFRL